jgi:NDP-sugar pyrophosphorylase family protein
MCGGKGIRFLPVTKDRVPKPLYVVDEKELMEYSLETLRTIDIEHIIFAVDHKHEHVREWVSRMRFPCKVTISHRSGTGIVGSLAQAISYVESEGVIVCNADEIRDGLDMQSLIDFHESHTTLSTMATTISDNLFRHRVINARATDSRILSTQCKCPEFREDPSRKAVINIGLYVFNKGFETYFDEAHDPDWSGIVEPLYAAGEMSAYFDGNIRYFNVGTPEEYHEAMQYLAEKNRSRREKGLVIA